MCALVAATMAWLNPASILDSFGWPQWDVWLPPFFLVAAVFVTLNWWAAAGFVLGLGCMFKGQLLFVAPVLMLAPLLAGWPGRFMRLVAGMGASAGLVIWPWLVTNPQAMKWIFLAVTLAAFFCLLSLSREFLWREGRELWNQAASDWPATLRHVTLAAAALLLALIVTALLLMVKHRGAPGPAVLLAAGIFLLPWFLPRRLIPGWILLTFASSLWMVGFYCGGSRTWWDVGFEYGTRRHQDMQLGANSLSNLSSILYKQYNWQLHDTVVSFTKPIFGQQELDVQSFTGLIFFATILLCSIAAAVHLRRRDPKFLVVLAAPWVLFTMLLTQMAARYTALPAVVSATLIGISAEMSLLAFLQTVLGCAMLGNQMLAINNDTAPIALSMTHPTYPELGWLTVTLAAVYLCCALIPSRNWRRRTEVI